MKLLYLIRVIVVSVEATLLLLAWLAWSNFHQLLTTLAKTLSLNEDLLKYLLLLPVGLGAWIASEVRSVLHEDKDTTRVLTAWPEYWKLKVHIWVSLSYALLFAAMSLVPWLAKSGISTPNGLLLFITSLAGQLVVAASVYMARLQVREYVIHASAA